VKHFFSTFAISAAMGIAPAKQNSRFNSFDLAQRFIPTGNPNRDNIFEGHRGDYRSNR
jgi:hypothetical protein